MRFAYRRFPTTQPAWTLGGLSHRTHPLVRITFLGPTRTWLYDGLVDTGADDTVFPEIVANRAGIDLTNAPTWTSHGVGGAPINVRGAEVTLRMTDGKEFREWMARVAFAPMPMTRGLLGYAGFLQFFD